jgi:hypothetical protein
MKNETASTCDDQDEETSMSASSSFDVVVYSPCQMVQFVDDNVIHYLSSLFRLYMRDDSVPANGWYNCHELSTMKVRLVGVCSNFIRNNSILSYFQLTLRPQDDN